MFKNKKKLSQFQNPATFLNRKYAIALSFIGILVIISHLIFPFFLKAQEQNSRIINLAGRQRMLSQRITKLSLKMALPQNKKNLEDILQKFQKDIFSWYQVHQGLQYGDANLGLPAKKLSISVQQQFKEMDPYFRRIYEASKNILLHTKKRLLDKDFQSSIGASLKIIEENEGEFLKRMDQLVFNFEAEAQKSVKQLKFLNYFLLFAILLILLLEILYIFLPSSRIIKEQFDDIQKVNQDITEAQNKLVQAEKMSVVGRVATGVAHEIQNPLQIIVQGLGVLKNNPISNSSEVKQTLTIIDQAVNRAGRILSELLDYSRVSKMHKQSLCLNHVLIKALDAVLYAKEEKENISIQTYWEQNDTPVMGDENHLIQVFINLINNAFQSKKDDEDLVVFIKTRLHPDMVECEIRDNGSGMDEKVLSKIFEPFFTTKGNYQGTGLGLSLSKTIIDQHHGTIKVSSEPGKGTVFRVFLPVSKENSV